MNDKSSEINEEGPWLWNPDGAAILSLFLTGAFGATIHAINWRRLGLKRKMWGSIMWIGSMVTIILVTPVVLAVAGVTQSAAGAHVLAVFGSTIAWYLASGRAQSKYVVFTLERKYRRDNWVVPVVAAVLVLKAPTILRWITQ